MILTTSGAFSSCQPISYSFFKTQSDPAARRVVSWTSCGICLLYQEIGSLVSKYTLQNKVLSGDEGIRTPDLRRAKAALSQLSYIPGLTRAVGLSGLEPETSPLSEARSNQLS
jgi:hypothetical protein